MLRARTTFIIGAAVSAELKLPLGLQLTSSLRAVLSAPSVNMNWAISTLLGQDQYRNARARLAASLLISPSIDTTLSENPDDAALKMTAKAAIAECIFAAENASRVQPSSQGSVARIGPSDAGVFSYLQLFELITSGVPTAELQEAFSRAAIISFNYDRCLEELFFRALYSSRNLSFLEAGALVSRMSIYHPYGRLAPLDWEAEALDAGVADGNSQAAYANGQGPLPFGGNPSGNHLLDAISRVKTFSEQVDSDTAKAFQDQISQSAQVIFLGCAPHRQNLELLRPRYPANYKYVYGTAYNPPPEGGDVSERSSPSIESFSAPNGLVFANSVNNEWLKDGNHVWTRTVAFEPLTARQLIGKYRATWAALTD